MGVWTSKPNTYNRINFIEIPEGDHRVQITRVSVERFREQKKCFEITMKVSGYHGKVWYYLWYNPENIEWGEKKFFAFFQSFQIENHNLDDYKDWVGKRGAIRVRHWKKDPEATFDYKYEVHVVGCLYGDERDNLPPWTEASNEVLYVEE